MAVLGATDALGNPLGSNDVMPVGQDFILNAAGSSDSGGGRLVRYHWTALDSVSGDFLANNPVTTSSDSLLVNNASDPVAAGSNRYQLVVEDDSGNLSDPVQIVIHVGNTPPLPGLAVQAIDTRQGGIIIPAHAPLNYATEPYLADPVSNIPFPRNHIPYGNNFSIITGIKDATQTPLLTLLDRNVSVNTIPRGKDFEIDAATTALSVGQHYFRLIIKNADGSLSAPMLIPVTITDGASIQISGPGPNIDYEIYDATDFSLNAVVASNVPGLGTISAYHWSITDATSGKQVYGNVTSPGPVNILNHSGGIAAGAYRIELVLEDNLGKQSQAYTSPLYIVNSVDAPISTSFAPVVLDEQKRIASGHRVMRGKNFYLTAERAKNAAPSVAAFARWHWTALDSPNGILTAGNTIVTNSNSLLIDAEGAPLPAGIYRYQVAVEDVNGLVSAPYTFQLHVLDSGDDNSAINFSADDDFTLSLWVKPGALIDNMVLFAQETDQTDSLRFTVQSTASGAISVGFDRFGTGWDSITSSNVLNSGQWTFISVTRTGDTVNIYANGRLQGQGSLSLSLGATAGVGGHYIGQFGNNPDPFADALISEVSIWDFAQSELEIRALMMARLHGDEAGLLAYWPLSQAAGEVARNLAGIDHGVLSSLAQHSLTDSPFGTITGHINEPVTLYLTGSDADGDALTARVTTLPLSGKLFQADGLTPILIGDTVTDSQGAIIYIAQRTKLVSDSFGFRVNDGIDDSIEKTVPIRLPNTRPVAGGASVNGLVAYYPFSDASLSLAQDASGRGHDGSNFNALATQDHNGRNTAYAFGKIGYLDMGDVNWVEDIDNLTISAWIKSHSYPSPNNNPDRNRNALASKWISGGSSSENSFMLSDVGPVTAGDSGGRISLLVGNGGNSGRGLAASHTLDNTQWHHIAAVFHNGIQEVFVDGQSVGSAELYYTYLHDTLVGPIRHIPSSATALLIGSWRPDQGYPSFDGALDEMRFYDRALSQTEIRQLRHSDGYTKATLNTPLPLTLQGFDADNDALSFKITSLPVNGQLFDLDGVTPLKIGDILKSKSSNQAQLIFKSSTPGLDDFGFVVNDGKRDSEATRYSIEVGATLD